MSPRRIRMKIGLDAEGKSVATGKIAWQGRFLADGPG